MFFVFNPKTAIEIHISSWSSNVCSFDLNQTGYPYRMTEPSPHLFPAARPAKDLPEDFLPAPTRLRHDGWTPDKQRLFVETLADTGCVSHAAKAVGDRKRTRLNSSH